MTGEKKSIIDQINTVWPMLAGLVAFVSLLVTTQVNSHYITRDLTRVESKVDALVEKMETKMADRFTGEDHENYVNQVIIPMKLRFRALELKVAEFKNGRF